MRSWVFITHTRRWEGWDGDPRPCLPSPRSPPSLLLLEAVTPFRGVEELFHLLHHVRGADPHRNANVAIFASAPETAFLHRNDNPLPPSIFVRGLPFPHGSVEDQSEVALGHITSVRAVLAQVGAHLTLPRSFSRCFLPPSRTRTKRPRS